jgi:hypothetical protein
MDPTEKMLVAAAVGLIIGYLIWGRKQPCPCSGPAPAPAPQVVEKGGGCKGC